MKKESFVMTESKEPGAVRFVVKGRITSQSSLEFQYKLEEAIKSERNNITLNMSQVEFLGSGGIRVILSIYKQTSKLGGKLRIESPSEMVRNVLGMAALDGMLM